MCSCSVFQGCHYNAEKPDYRNFNLIKKRGAFELYIPKYMFSDKKINSKAALAYTDSSNSTLFMLIKEQIPDTEQEEITITLENYYAFARQGIFNNLEDAREVDKDEITINTDNAIVGQLTGKFGAEKIYYCITVIKTENYFYQLIGWTLLKYKDTMGKDLCDIGLSFAELN